jgi:D-glycero-alpha-D-manno-heptose-7-phosphate kinase
MEPRPHNRVKGEPVSLGSTIGCPESRQVMKPSSGRADRLGVRLRLRAEKKSAAAPLRIIEASAPVRICDLGGWTDTWFSRHGQVFHIGVSPRVRVVVEALPSRKDQPRVVIRVGDKGPYVPPLDGSAWGREPLLEAAIASRRIPENIRLRVTTCSAVPPGAGTGTSASVVVALLGALERIGTGLAGADPLSLARAAHRIETESLGQQSGLQDQICAALGGVNFIEISYPEFQVFPMELRRELTQGIERRIALLYLGSPHRSTELHEKVIAHLEGRGADSPELEALRAAARKARQAWIAGDLDAFGQAMTENTEAQARLHPSLVGPDARKVIEIAKRHGATGVKVNGAGGEGGSLTLLCPSAAARASTLAAIRKESPFAQMIPVRVSRTGLRVRSLAAPS